MRVRSRVVLVACAALSLVAGIASLSGSAAARNRTTLQRVIVVFKNQDQAQPASRSTLARREASFRRTQAGVLSKLHAAGAKRVHSYRVIDAVSATVSSGEVNTLKSDPAVQEVIPDQIIKLATPLSGTGTGSSTSNALPGACAANGKVQLNPEALQTMSVASDNPSAKTARSLGITGAGTTVAFIADGLDINNPDFIRPNGQHVFVDYKDFTGEGTGVPTGGEEAFIDSSSIAAQGRRAYDVSSFGPLSLKQPCKIRIEGVAPGANLVGLDIFGAEDGGFNSAFLQAIDYAVTVDHVNVLNESLGNNYYPDDQASLDVIKQANDNAVAAGTVVTVSSGDAGVTSTIGTPSTDPNVISTGATTTYRIDAQDGYGGARFPGVTGWLDNNISSFSSGGFEQNGRTVDVVAPGELNWVLCSTDIKMYSECTNYNGQPTAFTAGGGTSESAPLTAGVAALVIEAYRKTHGGVTPPALLVKQLIASNTDDVGAPAQQQGTGLVDAYKAVLAAENYNGATGGSAAPDAALSDSATQLNAVDPTSTPESLTDTITNQSSRTQNLSFATRTVGDSTSVKTATVTLSDAASPKIVDWQGIRDNYQRVRFNVPYGENRLSASIAYQNASATDLHARVRLTLIDPTGKLASYDVPQGDGNFGNSQVTNPAPGTWTAYIYSRDTTDGGTAGPVFFGARVLRYTTFGQVSPASATLAPGQSVAVTMHVITPASPGDEAGAIVVNASRGGQTPVSTTTIPVTLRSLIPGGESSFSAVTTGGNGREAITGQMFTYQLDVPAGSPELNAYVTPADNPNYEFQAWLVDPAGQAEAFGSTTQPVGQGLVNLPGVQLHALSPAAGRWEVIVEFGPQASGQQLAEQFTVATNQAAIAAGAGGLPDSASTQLTAGQAYTYHVTIDNPGTAPEFVFPDARLPGSTTLALQSLLTSNITKEPANATSTFPTWLIPTDTTGLTEQSTTTGPQPIQFDSSAPTGDPDIISSFGQTATASLSGNPISQGLWSQYPLEYGAFGVTGGPAETVTNTASVTTAPFDPTVSSPTGDVVQAGVDPAAFGSFAPVTVLPGQTATIPVTVKPSGASGTPVTGTLYVDDFSELVYGGNYLELAPNQVAAIPYSYTVK